MYNFAVFYRPEIHLDKTDFGVFYRAQIHLV